MCLKHQKMEIKVSHNFPELKATNGLEPRDIQFTVM